MLCQSCGGVLASSQPGNPASQTDQPDSSPAIQASHHIISALAVSQWGFSQRQTPFTLIYIEVRGFPAGDISSLGAIGQRPGRFPGLFVYRRAHFCVCVFVEISVFLLMFLFVFRVLDTHPGTRVAPKDESMNNNNCVWGVPHTKHVSKIYNLGHEWGPRGSPWGYLKSGRSYRHQEAS